jgi:hypothetical protein
MNMPLAILNRRRRGFTAFSPSALFALAEPGVWYDPSDLTTLFTDPAGTTPVTAPGNTVGLMLDKSRGLTLGTELVTNGDFSNGFTGFTASGTGTREVVGGAGKFTITGASYTNTTSVSVVVGRTYLITLDMTGFSAAGARQDKARVQMLGAVSNFIYGSTSQSSFRFVFTAASTTLQLNIDVANSGAWGSVGDYVIADNISVRELAGNHATQATTTARPTYSIEPVGGRRNLLLQTEAFDDAAWTKTSGSITATNIADPIGGNTADAFTSSGANGYLSNFTGVAVQSGGTYVASVWLKLPSGTDTIFLAITSPSFDILQSVNCSVTSSWQRFTVSGSVGANTAVRLLIGAASTIGVGEVVYLWGAQLETGSTATPYQRVTTTYDVTEAGVASVSYLYFDGAGDELVTSTITPGIDKVQVFAGVRKLTNTPGMVVELGSISTGAFFLIPGSWSNGGGEFFTFASRGNASELFSQAVQVASGTPPVSAVLTGAGNIAADTTTLRVNGVAAPSATGDQGTGNYLTYPLYIGRRGSYTLPFQGHLYSLITRFGATLDAPTIASTETYVAGKTGFYTPIITGVPTVGVS